MPTGTFQSYDLTPDNRAGGSYGGGMTGTGAPSQPKYPWDTAAPPKGSPGYANWDYMTQNDPARQQQYQQDRAVGSLQYGTNAFAGQLPNYMGATGASGVANMLAQGMYGPQQQILADQLKRQQTQLGQLAFAEIPYQQDILRRDNALAQQLLGMDRQQLGLDTGLAQGQLGNIGKLRAILDKRRGLAGEGKQLGVEQALDKAGRSKFDLQSDLTSRGAFNTVANERGLGRIATTAGFEIRGVDQQYRNTLLGLDEQGISYDNQAAALNHKLSSIGLDSSRLDISEQQLQNALADGLHNIGFGGMVNINQLLDAMGQTGTQQAGLAGEIFNAILGYSNLPPEIIQQIMGQMMGSGYGSGGAYSNTTGTSNGQRTGGNYGQ